MTPVPYTSAPASNEKRMKMTLRSVPTFWRTVVAVAVVLGAASLLMATSARAATQPATATLDGSVISPGTGAGFGIYNFTISHDGAGAFPFTTGAKRGHCVEFTVTAEGGDGILRTDGDVALNPAASTSDQDNRVAWLVQSSTYSQDTPGASTLDADLTADAHQSAIWQYTDPDEAGAVSGDASVAAEASRLIAAAEANKGAAQQQAAMAAVGPAPGCGGGTQAVEVRGAPFTTAEVAVSSGSGTFPGGGTSVALDLGPDGVATTSVTAAGGTVVLSATIAQSKLVHVDFGSTQDFAYVETTPVPVQLRLEFPPCTKPGAPNVPTTGQRRASLRITKRGPRRVRAGGRISYLITVRNASRVAARNVVIRDRLPSGMVLRRRIGGMAVRGRTVSIRVGTIGPRRTVRKRVYVSVLRETRGRRCNVARVTASNAPARGARTCARVIRVARRVSPAVTG
jgi:uncharacterized repeat protein (TIGR01451 family)